MDKFFSELMDELKKRAEKQAVAEADDFDPELVRQKSLWVYPIANPHPGYGGMADMYMTM